MKWYGKEEMANFLGLEKYPEGNKILLAMQICTCMSQMRGAHPPFEVPIRVHAQVILKC